MSDASAARPEPVRAPRFGLSGKLLVFTILFVMIAEVLIYVPSIAIFRVSWLNDRLASAYTAALVLDAAPNGMVPDSLAKQILDSIGARAVAMKMGTRRRMLAVGDAPPPIADDFDMRNVYNFDAIVDAFKTMLDTRNNVMRVVGPAPMGGDYIEIVMDEQPLRKAMLRYSVDLLLISLLISGITAALVYLTLHYMFVRPMRRVTANMMAFRADPENADRIIVPSGRADEIGIAERELATMQAELASTLHQKNRLAALGLAVSKINHELRNLLGSAQLILRPAVEPARSRRAALRAQAGARARARHRLLPIDAVLRPPAGTAAGTTADPARALGRGGARNARARPRCADPLDQRGRARADRGGRLRPAVSHPAQSRPQRRAGAGKPRGARSEPRPDPHHRPPRRRGGGDRSVRHRPGFFRTRARASVRGVPELDPHRRHRPRACHRRRTGARPWRRHPPRRRHHRGDAARHHSRPCGGIERPPRGPGAWVMEGLRRKARPTPRISSASGAQAVHRLFCSVVFAAISVKGQCYSDQEKFECLPARPG